MNKLFISAVLLSIYGTSFSQTKLIEKVAAKPGEPSIPYERYQLANGLTLIVHEDHSDPVVHTDVTYHVGSAREELGRSGFAHFYEHMMFQGSDHVADEEHFKLVSEAGGTMNGSTNSDRTNYFETLPSNKLEMALWLESDRMGWLLDAVTQQKFEIQRATVKNERGQNYDNRPYGLIYEKTNQALYPYGHPYSWSTIGYLDELDRATLDDLKKFFLRWYGPNNAVLTVAGDVNTQEVVKLAEKYFGPVNRGPEVTKASIAPVKLDADKYISYEDNIRFPAIVMTYPTIPNFHADEPALDVLSDILGGGKNSLFFKNFDKAQIAVQSRVSHPCTELTGSFMLSVFALPGSDLKEMEAKIRATLDEFETRGVNDDDLNSYKARHEAQVYEGLQNVAGKAGQLASYFTLLGNANYIGKDIERYNKVTKEDVMRVFKQYIKGQKGVILSVVPKGDKKIAAPDNFKVKLTDANFKPNDDQYKGLVYNKPSQTADKFDRSKKPASGANPVMKVPTVKKGEDGGVKYIITPYDELPIVSITVLIKAGHRFEPADKAGLAYLTGALMDESTLKHTTEEIAMELDKLGSSISYDIDDEDLTFEAFSLTKNLDKTIAILNEKLFFPAFNAEDFERKKQEQLEYIGSQVTQAAVLANNAFRAKIYGDGNLAVPEVGNEKTVSSITIDDVKEYYKAIRPEVSRLVVVGSVTEASLKPIIDNLKSKTAKPKFEAPKAVAAPKPNGFKVYYVNKEKAPQSEIRIGYLAYPFDATGKYYLAQVTNFAFGGNFNSRINLNLREAKGYTYGCRSGFEGTDVAGPFTVSGGFKGNVTDSSLIELTSELKKFNAGGATPEEIEFTKSSLGQADALKFEAPAQKARFLKRLLDYKLEPSYIDEQNRLVQSINFDIMKKSAAENFDLSKMVCVIVGDPSHIAELRKAGFTVEEVK